MGRLEAFAMSNKPWPLFRWKKFWLWVDFGNRFYDSGTIWFWRTDGVSYHSESIYKLGY
jgi:hypothetical protein